MGALLVPSLVTTLVVCGAEGVVRGSIYRSGYELVYTPLGAAPKHKEKMIIDVAVDRIGTIAGGALAALAVWMLGRNAPEATLALAAGAALLALLTLPNLHRGYVDALARRLRSGALALSPDRILDATTRQTLTESVAIDRNELLRAIDQARSDSEPAPSRTADTHRERGEHSASLTAADRGFDVAPASLRMMLQAEEDFDPVLQQAAELRSGVAERILHALRADSLPVELVGHAIPLLGNDLVAREALAKLRQLGPRITGQLGDALCNRAFEAKIRRRLPRALETSANRRAVEALVEALFDEVFNVRYQAALSLARLTSEYPELEVPRDRIIEAAIAELGRGTAAWARYVAAEADAESPLFDAALRARTGRGVELVMSMLASILEREPLRLACRALFSDDAALRGTALEYLDNVLPEPIKRAGMPFLDELDRMQQKGAGQRRAHPEIVRELLSSGEIPLSAAVHNPSQK
jgi:hypothetical protein